MSQPEVARIINVTTNTITNWELNINEPTLYQIPKIISFLGYSPITEKNPIKAYQLENGICQRKLAKIMGIDQETLSKIENGRSKRISEKVKRKITKLLPHAF